MQAKYEIETGHPIPKVLMGLASAPSVDFSSVAHGSSILVESAKKGQSIRSCLNNYKKRNPDKLVGFCCAVRKERDKYRVFFIDPAVL